MAKKLFLFLILKVTQAADSFINAFIVVCSTRFKSQISQKVHPDTIRGALSSVNLDAVLGIEEVHQVFKQCYGIKHWMVAPEEGTRGVLRASLQLYEAPLRQILMEMHAITLEAAKLSMKSSAKTASRAQGGVKYSLADDAVRQLLFNQAENLVEQWRDQTWEQLRRNLHAEAEFPAPERFAKLKSRLQELLGAEAAKQAARQNEVYKRMLMDTLNQLQSTATLKSHPLHLTNSLPPTPIGKAAARAAPARSIVKEEEPPSWSEFFMGWLMKENRHGLFQRRWFALSIRQQKLWYFANPEEQPARGTGHLIGAKIISLIDAAEEEEEFDEDRENKKQKTFRIVFSSIADQNQVAIPLEAQKAAEALTGQKTKTLTTEMTLRAASVASKNQWCEMLNKAIIGVPEAPKVEQASAAVAAGNGGLGLSVGQVSSSIQPDPFVEDRNDSTHVGRKISTKIFHEKEEESNKTVKKNKDNKKKATREARSVSNTSSEEEEKSSPTEEHVSSDEEKEEENEEARAEREMALFDEIAAQAEYTATPEEKAVLECVSLAVKEYIVDALGYLTEQASRIIADGMLPVTRAEELHSKLLRVLITGREGGLAERFGKGEFSSDTEL